jgi:pyruvate formate lyase activating enzyme
MEAAYWEKAEGGGIACHLCPHHCVIGEGRTGLCRVRANKDGVMALPYQGLASSIAVDPIEKKPLYHFLPGSRVFSVGFWGCNLRCPFCQNWEISQRVEASSGLMSGESLVEAALASATPSLAFTYSEPTVHFEFLIAAMTRARAAGLKTVLVTNGCLEEGPATELLALTDAVNVDLKTWDAETYSKVLGGERKAVLRFIELAAAACHVELTTLVVPGISEGREDMAHISRFIAALDPDIPLHLSAYRPAWKYEAPPTRPDLLEGLARIAQSHIRNVYVGNLGGRPDDSFCASCGALLVRRRGYDVRVLALEPLAQGRGARCAACGAPQAFILS